MGSIRESISRSVNAEPRSREPGTRSPALGAAPGASGAAAALVDSTRKFQRPSGGSTRLGLGTLSIRKCRSPPSGGEGARFPGKQPRPSVPPVPGHYKSSRALREPSPRRTPLRSCRALSALLPPAMAPGTARLALPALLALIGLLPPGESRVGTAVETPNAQGGPTPGQLGIKPQSYLGRSLWEVGARAKTTALGSNPDLHDLHRWPQATV